MCPLRYRPASNCSNISGLAGQRRMRLGSKGEGA
jgi:hypothetical protein